jgi:hypothetical protein
VGWGQRAAGSGQRAAGSGGQRGRRGQRGGRIYVANVHRWPCPAEFVDFCNDAIQRHARTYETRDRDTQQWHRGRAILIRIAVLCIGQHVFKKTHLVPAVRAPLHETKTSDGTIGATKFVRHDVHSEVIHEVQDRGPAETGGDKTSTSRREGARAGPYTCHSLKTVCCHAKCAATQISATNTIDRETTIFGPLRAGPIFCWYLVLVHVL